LLACKGTVSISKIVVGKRLPNLAVLG